MQTKEFSLKKKNTTSQYDPSRDTVGKIYRDLQINSKGDHILVGDMTNEIMKDFKVDVEEGLAACFKHSKNKNEGRPFYLMIHEKKDLQMKNALCRVRHYFGFLPWPEDDTTVFYGNPKTNSVHFCWSIPHSSEMDNIIMNPNLFDPLLVMQVKAWKAFDLRPFGFIESQDFGWIPNPHHKFTKIGEFHDGSRPEQKPIRGSTRDLPEGTGKDKK